MAGFLSSTRRHFLPMLSSARLFLCARCDSQVFLCRRCDRGNWYCGKACSIAARTQAQRESRQRHARTRRGRLNNAERQRRHRARRASHNRNKVTDQGSTTRPRCSSSDKSPNTVTGHAGRLIEAGNASIRCHRCRCVCDPFLRSGFLAASLRDKRSRSRRHTGRDP